MPGNCEGTIQLDAAVFSKVIGDSYFFLPIVCVCVVKPIFSICRFNFVICVDQRIAEN